MGEPRLKDSRWQTASKAEWELARRREAVVRPLAETSPLSPVQVDEAAQQLGLCRSLTYRLIARYRRRPRTSSLLPGRRGRRRRSRFLDPVLEGVIHKSIKDVFLTQERPRISDLMREIRTSCNKQGLPAPNYRTVRRRLASIDPLTVLGKRYGTKAARELFRPMQASKAFLLRPLEVVQVEALQNATLFGISLMTMIQWQPRRPIWKASPSVSVAAPESAAIAPPSNFSKSTLGQY